ncbi:MAG: hypothetical protein LBK65_10305 [Tannerellaceae bacterium]|nr:hypothetical protein [Tannerellaceae bacterium]
MQAKYQPDLKHVVADWTDADNLPTFEEGSVVAGFNPVVSSSQGVSINNYSVDYSEATVPASAQLYYVSTSNVKPTATVEALNGTHSGAISVNISNPVAVTYTAGYMSTVTISLSVTKVPVDLRVNLAGNGGDAQTVNIISVPPYTDTRYPTQEPYKPVLRWACIYSGDVIPVFTRSHIVQQPTLLQALLPQMIRAKKSSSAPAATG